MIWLGSGTLLLVLLLLGAPARAEPARGPLVVVVSSNIDAPFVRRLAAELSLFGYRVALSARDAGEGDLGELLAAQGGAALIAVDQGRQTAEIIVGERAGNGPFRHERERLDPRRRADTNAAVLAERFRARLTELGIVPGAEPAQALAPEPPVPLLRAPERRLWLAGRLGGWGGGLGAMPELELELRVYPVPWLSTGAFALLSPFAARVSGREGEADVRLFAGGVLIDAHPLRGDFALNAGLGAMLLNAAMSGRAAPPWRGQDDSVLVPGAMFESGAAFRVSPRVSLELRGFIGVLSPRVAVRLAGRRAAEFGQPFVGASLGGAVGVF